MNISVFNHASVGVTDWSSNVNTVIKTDGCILFMCIDGHADVFINIHKTRFRKGDLIVLTSDVFFKISELSKNFATRYVSLSEEMIENAYYRISSSNLWDYLHYMAILRPDIHQREVVEGWFRQVEWIFENLSDGEQKNVINNCVYNLFTAINHEMHKYAHSIETKRKDRAWTITCKLWSAIARNAKIKRSVRYYADLLNVTPGYLNKVCRKAFGMSPQGLIHQQIIVDMKSYLSDSRSSICEISDLMNFNDVSYMCRFFKRMTGMTPLEFRHATTPTKES